ncbi:MAG TPA: SIR2 family protein [Candidatus Sulfotelmatobacter sp.]|nr:SIR2 family protein [Candidatus Sulfotelmatobacter sp.]
MAVNKIQTKSDHIGTVDKNAAVASKAKPAITSFQNHCPYRQAALLQQALTPDKMRIAFFLGAGCPVAIRIANGNGTDPLIPDIRELTKQVSSKIEGNGKFKSAFIAILQRLADAGVKEPNIEQILTHIRVLGEVIGNSTIDGLSKTALNEMDEEICRLTTDVVKIRLPGDDTPYHHLATWIGGVQRAHPVEIFTPNYDLLTEQALEQRRVPYFDGFVGSDRTFFDVASMEQDNLPPRWSRLWKVHGSINWWRTALGNVERRADGGGDRQMIYPSHLKYDQSRRLPYLAMLDRLRAFLGRGQAILITCGYSFSDQHLNEVILQGLSGNPNSVCFGLLYGDRAEYPEAVNRARKQSNLSLLAFDGAVLNTIERDWHSEKKEDHILHGLAVETGEFKERTKAQTERCKFLLGDFKSFGAFLAHHLAYREKSDVE